MRSLRLALGMVLPLALACGGSETGPGTTAGQTSVFLTDAPFPFDGVSRVDIHVVSIAFALRADTSDGDLPWVTVATPDRTFNLFDLQNGSTSLLGGAVIPPGDYMAVRMIIDPNRSSITDTDGHVITSTETPGTPGIDWQAKGSEPSLFAQVEEPVAIDANGEDIVLDFDVGRSFLYDGHGGFTFIPWLRAIVRSASGAVTGVVTRADGGEPIVNAAISVQMAFDSSGVVGPVVATSRSASDGRFTAAFLRPGSYYVVAEDLARDVVSISKKVEVRAGGTADAGEISF
ncbi:MAG TPA: DUF4382 domain-containing protein [Gemmatimonadales bacterium]|jgi:hypothetical protein